MKIGDGVCHGAIVICWSLQRITEMLNSAFIFEFINLDLSPDKIYFIFVQNFRN